MQAKVNAQWIELKNGNTVYYSSRVTISLLGLNLFLYCMFQSQTAPLHCCRMPSNETMNKDQLCVFRHLSSISVSIPEMSVLLDVNKWRGRTKGNDGERWKEGAEGYD